MGPAELAFEAYGVRVAVACDSGSLLGEVRTILPPGARELPDNGAASRFALSGDDSSGYELRAGDTFLAATADRDVALGVLDAKIRAEVSSGATDWTFVHAGVVALGEHALVIPGDSFSGKTTLVRALIEAGATYFSDEYAVLDADGRVYPYPRPLSIRGEGGTTEIDAASLGARTASEAAEIAVVALAPHRAGAHWQPRNYPPGQAALVLLSHAIPARDRPQDVLGVVSRAAANARLLEGERGEAPQAAAALLRTLEYSERGSA